MILMCHQPNFLPYLGYFYKMYRSDVYSASDACGFTNHRENGIHNYNFINEFGKRAKITIPVDRHSGRICDVRVAPDWEPKKRKLLNTIYHSYRRAPHFDEVWADIEPLFQSIKAGQSLVSVNLSFTNMICAKMGIARKTVLESGEADLPTDPDDAIIHMCKKLGCDKYMVGVHGGQYMDFDKYRAAGIELVYSDFDESKDPTGDRLSILDYIMNHGYEIPKEWKRNG